MVQAVIQTTVTGLQGNPVAAGTPGGNQSLTWNGTSWAPAGPFFSSAGGTLTGPLVLAGNATAQLNPVPLQQLQAGYLPLAGGTITGSLSVNGAINVGGNANLAASSTILFGGQWAISDSGGVMVMFVPGGPGPVFQLNSSGNLSTGAITTSGNANIAGTAFAAAFTVVSDQTTKNTIATYAPGVSLAAQLEPKSFIFNGDANNTQHLGFIAQDIQPLIPNAVSQITTTNASGASTTILGLDTTAIVAVLANAVKQLISRVQALESHDGITPSAAQTA